MLTVKLLLCVALPDDALRAYASVYLDQEVRLEGWARDIGGFARFLEAISFSHAGVLNPAGIARGYFPANWLLVILLAIIKLLN